MTDNKNVSQFELGWMAGIVDGEGCLYMTFKEASNFIGARVQVQACDYEMIKYFSDLLYLLQIKHVWKKRNTKQKNHHRNSYILDIQTKPTVLKFTRLFKDLLVVKKHQCVLMNEYLERAIKEKRYSPSERDKEIVQLVKSLKKNTIEELLENPSIITKGQSAAKLARNS